MTVYLLVKTAHILSATILFGTGVGTAYFMWSANRTRDSRVVASVAKHVVRADWLFTTPTVVLQPLSGAWLVYAGGYSWFGWVGASLILFGLVGACWLPVMWLQLRMRDIAASAAQNDEPLPGLYWRYERMWFWLGVAAFAMMIATFCLMVLKPNWA